MLTSSNFKSNKNKQLLVIFSMASLFLFGLTLKTEAKVISVGTTTDTIYMGGSLGVGTTDPGVYKLNVVGGLRAGSNSYIDISASYPYTATLLNTANAGNVIVGAGSGTGLSQINLSGNTVATGIQFLTNNVERMRVADGGNVGIGITAPNDKLDVVGNIRSTGFVYSNANGSPWWINGTGNGAAIMLQKNTAAGGPSNRRGSLGWNDNADVKTEILTWSGDSGSVGIGITAPGTKLDIAGTFRNSLATTHSLLAGSGNVVVMSDNTGALYTVTQASLLGGVANFWGGTKNGNIWNGDAGAGNVGIGTTNPLNKLDIQGASVVGGTFAGAYTAPVNGLLVQGFVLAGGATSTLAGTNNQLSGIFTTQSASDTNERIGPYSFQSGSGSSNIAIGTMSGRFKVGNSNIFIGSDAARYMSDGTQPSPANMSSSLYIGASTRFSNINISNEIVIGSSAVGAGSNSVVLGSDAITKTLLKGNVGIGTTAPGAKLEVNGDLFMTAGGVNSITMNRAALFLAGNDDCNAAVYSNISGSNCYNAGHGNDTLAFNGYNGLSFATRASGDNVRMYIQDSNGNVGIGTTNPLSTLHIVSPSQTEFYGTDSSFPAANLVLQGTESSSTVGKGPSLLFAVPANADGSNTWSVARIMASTNSSANGNLYLQVRNNYNPGVGGSWNWRTGLFIRSDGLVGVGTTNPGTKLDISGTLRNSLATTHSLLGGAGNVVVMADNTGALYNAPVSTFFSSDTNVMTNRGGVSEVNIDTATGNGYYQVQKTGHSSGLLTFNPGGSTGPFQMDANYYGLLRWRNKTDSSSWQSWRSIFSDGGTNLTNNFIPKVTSGTNATLGNSAIFDNGNIGIGTTAPSSNLSVYSSTASVSGNPLIRFSKGAAPLGNIQYDTMVLESNDVATLRIGESDGTTATFTSGDSFTTLSSTHPIRFYTSGVATGLGYSGMGGTQRMIITNDGNIGVGTASPISQMSGTTGIGIYNANYPAVGFKNDTTSWLWYGQGATFKMWNVSAGDILTGTSGGLIGIGNTAPGTKLDVSGTFRNSLATTHSLLAGSGNVVVMADNTGTLYTSAAASSLLWSGSTSGNIWNANSGAVGIGTTAPSASLDVNGSVQFNKIDNVAKRFIVAANRSVGANAGDYTYLGNISDTGLGTYATIYESHHDCGTINSATYEIKDVYYAGATTDWMQVPTHSYQSYNGGQDVAIDVRRTTNGGGFEVRIRNVGGPCGTVNTHVEIQTNGGFSPSATTGTGGTVAGYLASNVYQFPVANNRFTASTNGLFILNSGLIGIGKTNPAKNLDVVGDINASLTVNATGLCIGGVCKTDWNSLVPIAGNVTLTGPLTIPGLSLTGDLDLTWHNIRNVTKLSVGTIDPLYNINGIKYSTYAASIAGGVKEEYVGKANLKTRNIINNEYEAVIDFAKIEKGSDLWVWRKVIDFNKENVDVSITPYGQLAQVYYLINNDKLIFRSNKPVEISYRLIANRFDWKKWPTKATDQTEETKLIIND